MQKKTLSRQVRNPLDPTKRVRVYGETETELQYKIQDLARVRRDLREGRLDPREARRFLAPRAGVDVRLRDLWPQYRETVSRRSFRQADSTWKHLVCPYLGDLAVWDLDAGVIARWESRLLAPCAERPDGYAPKTVQIAWWQLTAMVRTFALGRIVERIPWEGYRSKSAKLVRLAKKNGGGRAPRQALSSLPKLEAVLLAARDLDEEDHGPKGFRFFAVGFLALTGLRQAEAAGLGWDYVEIDDPENRFVRVQYQAPKGWRLDMPGDRPRVPPKNGPQTQRLHPSVVALLQVWRQKVQDMGLYRAEGPVFPAMRGRGFRGWRLTGQVIASREFRRALERAGIPSEGWRPHHLRHSFSTLESLASGGDLRGTQMRTGHSSLEILAGYIHQFGGGAFTDSRIPELSPTVLGAHRELVEAPGAEVLELPESRVAERRAEVRALPPPKPKGGRWGELAREWVSRRRERGRPREVSDAAKNAYSRAYARELKNGKDKAAAAGRRARRAVLAAWGRALAQAEREE